MYNTSFIQKILICIHINAKVSYIKTKNQHNYYSCQKGTDQAFNNLCQEEISTVFWQHKKHIALGGI